MTEEKKTAIELGSNIDIAMQRFLHVQQGAQNSGLISFAEYLERAGVRVVMAQNH